MTTRFNNAVTALVRAFFDDTLEPCTACACAVGNIVAFGYGGKIEKLGAQPSDMYMFIDGKKSLKNIAWYSNLWDKEWQKENEDLTGYSIAELRKIEPAFMSFDIYKKYLPSGYAKTDQERIYAGLLAVVDVLIELDNIPNGNEYKKYFEYTNDFKPQHAFVSS